ncbi:hypothetical protein DLAC_11113 [Tieghemostelium lacteum]|uniref:Mitochondrial inner membrane protease ATP23 n=1 Tax=Tieghemostelium lacteum TaxID=361077 RepID=A0A151Z378_TIELA|nr:hypothetical protein DLAC_11113 [Tieghemostelium lacteum]|eukprot:KYQ88412.1 hypothetical protein DLAC_11113 [Tieghemostelium lacteum]
MTILESLLKRNQIPNEKTDLLKNKLDYNVLCSKTEGGKGQKSAFKESDNKLCTDNVVKVLQESPILQYIIKEMKELGCLPPVIKCAPCKEETFGFFIPKEGVLICDNIVTYPENIRNTVVHEFIHAFDMCKVKLDTFNCEHLACTEIRAANLSGDCTFDAEAVRGNISIYNHLQECSKRRAIKSLERIPQCSKNAEKFVLSVWDKCNRDYSPFETIPKHS